MIKEFKTHFVLVLCFFVISNFSFAQSLSLVVSRINNQEMFTNSRMEVYFSTLNNTKDVVFTGIDLPSFGKVINFVKGDGKFVFEPTSGDKGSYIIGLTSKIEDTGARHTQYFKLVVNDPGNNLIYIDPKNGDDSNDGSISQPFKSLDKVLATGFVFSGETVIYLKDGNYGIKDFSKFNTSMVYVVAAKGSTPEFEKLRFNFAKNWTIEGMKISPAVSNKKEKGIYVTIPGGTKNIVVKNCKIYGTLKITDWPKTKDWDDYAGDGIRSSGKDCSFLNNRIFNTDFPVTIFGKNNYVSYNLVTNFSGDAMRGLGNYNTFSFNQIKNAVVFDYYDAGGNHDDAFQSWTVGNPVVGIVFKGNQITDISYPDLPLQTKIMQGVVDFDGFAEDWVVENNLLVIHHQHGITLLGARNCKIVNNTVVKNPFKIYNNGDPWIGIWSTKPTAGSLKSTGNLVRNNISGAFTDTSPPAPQGLKDPGDIDHNYTSPHFNSIFVDYSKWDFRLKSNTVAVDRGEREDGAYDDIEGYIRNIGNIDLGCYEKGASIRDFEAPAMVGEVKVDEFGPTHAKLSWEAVQDAIKYYHIVYEDKEIIVSEPRCLITDLYSYNDYTFRVYAEDLAGNKSEVKSVSISTPVFDNDNFTIYAGGVSADQEITNKNNKKWSYGQYLKIGGTDSKTDLSGVLVFKIPSTPPDKKIIGINLSLYYDKRVGFPTGNVDMYGMDYERKSLIKKNIFWQGEYGGNEALGMALSDNFIGQTMSPGYIESDISTSDNLLSYLSKQYENGAHGNNFLFLRLNVDVENEVKDSYYRIVSADNYRSFKRPLLKFVLDHNTAVETVGENDIMIYPNPVLEVLNIKNYGANCEVDIIDIKGKTCIAQRLVEEKETITLSTKELKKGFYFARIIIKNRVIVKKFVKL